ncbi:hypothetical protein SH580_07360 [Coraliomargarita algicola]|uniref:Uncharacterized protein n=1 Tax=Coraliomargarita algicola TaxID=3092156 RepID=A0ABZ0RMS5_9BACT|nr:hypothetical protein [Coraliomargarita sp. J2-16]WPJ97526.1 hypothetical protein SH580_07360 [Coraliomargarita sp. J2-16]
MSVFGKIPKTARNDVLETLLDNYVERQGLGAMPKADFDALLIHTFLKHSKEPFDSFTLSELFKIKESRLKALLETAAVKFEEDTIETIWMDILKQWKTTITEVNRIESGEVRFKLENPAYFRYVQREVRIAEGTVKYDKNSEAIVVSLSTLFKVLDHVHGVIFKDLTGHQALIKDLIEKIKKDLIGENELKKMKDDKEKKLKLTQIISTASSLSSIGGLIQTIFFPA